MLISFKRQKLKTVQLKGNIENILVNIQTKKSIEQISF